MNEHPQQGGHRSAQLQPSESRAGGLSGQTAWDHTIRRSSTPWRPPGRWRCKKALANSGRDQPF